jgi:septal ring-binding cell division protein DamX
VLVPLSFVVVLVLIAVAIWLAYSAQTEVRQLRRELDETQRQLNELKAAAEVVPAPPPLPRTRSSGLEDLREQLRAAHREEGAEE